MNKKKLGKTNNVKQDDTKNPGRTYPRPAWVPKTVLGEEELCPDCFKVVGEKSRYNLVCTLGKNAEGMTVGELTETMKLRQPTVTHHLQVLRSVDAVEMEPRGRERVYKLNRDAHCFEECKIPY
jgi:predicted transcriptional regulator